MNNDLERPAVSSRPLKLSSAYDNCVLEICVNCLEIRNLLRCESAEMLFQLMVSFFTHSDAVGFRIGGIKASVYLARAELKHT